MTRLEEDLLTTLMYHKATNGALSAVLVHINGLDEMIKTIGGLQNVSSPDLQRLILWWVNILVFVATSLLIFPAGRISIVQMP